jgi:hypothetical protein
LPGAGAAALAELTGGGNSSEVVAMSRQGAFTALILSGLLVLSACGSSQSASPVAVRVGSTVHIGPYTQVFDSPLPANPAQASVVEGFREAQVLWEKSENAQHLIQPARGYVTGQALAHLNAAVKAGKSRDLVPAGVDRFFKTRVTAITGHNATVATCDDGSRFKEENPRTGTVNVAFVPTPGQAYIFETWRMVQFRGHWAITAFSAAPLPSRSAEPCQPGMTGPGPSRQPNVAALLRQMSAAMRAASGVHIGGAIQSGGKTLGVNISIARSGGAWGQISVNGAAVTVLVTHGHGYLKISPAFLQISHLPAAACSRFCGKYLEYRAAISRRLLTGLSMASMTHSLTREPAREVKYLGAVTIGGQLAWLLQDSHEDSLYIAAHGRPYVLREVAPPPGEDSADLTQWNAVRIPGPPPASQVVKLNQLTG